MPRENKENDELAKLKMHIEAIRKDILSWTRVDYKAHGTDADDVLGQIESIALKDWTEPDT